MQALAFVDLETTGATASIDRITEIGIVEVDEDGSVREWQQLVNPGTRIPPFIEQLTGISNAMVRSAPPVAQVMAEAAEFIGEAPLLAHNAAFDSKFWDAELGQLGRRRSRDFACSLLLSRRLLPEAPSHKLGNLNSWVGLPSTGQAHRALADAEMAANLTLHLQALLWERHDIRADHDYLCGLQKLSAAKVRALLRASV